MATFTRRHFLGLTIGAGATLLAAGCGGTGSATATAGSAAGGAPSPASAAAGKPAASAAAGAPANAKLDHVKVGFSPLVSYAGMFIGADRGYFHTLGLEIEYVPFAGAADMAAPLAADQIDIADADPSSAFLNASARGIAIRFVGDGSHTSKGHSSAAMVIRKDLSDSGAIKDYPDLKGKKISAVGKGSLVDSWVHRILEKGGLKEADVDLQYVPFPDCIPALGNKALDAALLVEPLVTTAVGKGVGARWKGMDDVFGQLQNTVMMYSANMATKRQDVGKRFMAGYIKGIRDYIDAFDNGKDRDAIVAILSKNTSIKDAALYSKMVMPEFDPNGQMNVPSMKDIQQWFVDNGYVKTPADFSKVIDMSYVDYAVAQDGRR